MKGISKPQREEIERLTGELASVRSDIEAAIDDYNATMAEKREMIQNAISAYNGFLTDLRAIYEAAHSEADEYMSERSDRWQEGEKGQTYLEWVNSLEGIDGVDEDLVVELPEPLDCPDMPDWRDASSVLPENSPE